MTTTVYTENTPAVNNSEHGDAFVTPDGRVWSCHHGVHGFAVEQIIAELGFDGARGSLLLLAEGTWFQEQATGTITDGQREAIELLAGFPECGIKTAANDILARFADNAARRNQSARQLADAQFKEWARDENGRINANLEVK